jgi:hypothetical protein
MTDLQFRKQLQEYARVQEELSDCEKQLINLHATTNVDFRDTLNVGISLCQFVP